MQTLDKTSASTEPRPPRISTPVVLAEIGDAVFSLERGLLWTFWQLCRRPGWSLRRYIEWRDERTMRPLRYLLVCLAFAAILLHLTGASQAFLGGVEAGALQSAQGEARPAADAQHIAAVFARFDLLLLLIFMPSVGLAIHAAYRRTGIHLAEAIVISAFLLAQVSVLSSLAIVGFSLMPWIPKEMGFLAGALLPVYLGFAIASYFRPDGCGIGRSLWCLVLSGFLASLWVFLVVCVVLLMARVLA